MVVIQITMQMQKFLKKFFNRCGVGFGELAAID